MAQGYGLGNAFSDILNSYVGMKQVQQRNALAEQELELRRQQMDADERYRNSVLNQQDRTFYENQFQSDRQFELERPGIEAQNKSSEAAASEAVRKNNRGTNAQNMSIYQGAFGAAPATVSDVTDVLNGDSEKEAGLRALFANPNVAAAAGGQIDDIFIIPGSENRPEGPLYGIGVKNPKTGTRGPVTSGRGTAGNESVAVYDEAGLQQLLNAAYDVGVGESGIAPARGNVAALGDVINQGRAAEQSTVRDIDPRQFAANAAEMQEVEQQRAAQPASPQTQNNAARLGQLQDASASLATQIAEQNRVVSGLDDMPGASEKREAAEARLGQLQNQKAQIDDRIAAETPRPDAAKDPRPQPQRAPDVDSLLNNSATRVQEQSQALAAPFIDMAQQGADQRNAAAAYTGNNVTDSQLASALSMQMQGQLQPGQTSNIIGSGDPSGAREQRIANRMADGSEVMGNSMDSAASIVENVNDSETSRLDNTLTTFKEMREAELDAITESQGTEQETLDAFEEDGKNAAVSEGYTGPFADRVGARYRQAASSEFANNSVVAAVISERYRGQDLAQSFTRMEAALSRFGQGDRTTSDDNWLERNISSLANPIRKYWTGNTISQDQSLGMAVLSDILGISQMDFLVDVANPAISSRSGTDPLTARRLQYAILVAGTPEFARAGPRIRKAEMTRLLQKSESEFNQYVEDITGEKP